MKRSIFLVIISISMGVLLYAPTPSLWAAQIKLKNGDVLTGKILAEDEELIRLEHPVLGKLEISKKEVREVSSEEGSAKAPAQESQTQESQTQESQTQESQTQEPQAQRHKGDLRQTYRLAFGYDITQGNTDTEAIHLEGLASRNRLWIDEWTLRLEFDRQVADGNQVYRRAFGKVRYAFTFWEKFYNFYLAAAEYDRFENVELRLTPTTGVGYWFCDTEEMKLLTEVGAGYEVTYYRQGRPDKEEAAISHLRAMFEKKIGAYRNTPLLLGADASILPHLDEPDRYRVESELYLGVSLSESLSLKLKWQDEYNSEPPEGFKNNDLRFITSLEYNF